MGMVTVCEGAYFFRSSGQYHNESKQHEVLISNQRQTELIYFSQISACSFIWSDMRTAIGFKEALFHPAATAFTSTGPKEYQDKENMGLHTAGFQQSDFQEGNPGRDKDRRCRHSELRGPCTAAYCLPFGAYIL